MAQTVELQVAPRTLLGKAAKRLRQADIIPANIYGHKEPSVAVQIEAIPFDRVRREHARSVLSLRLPNGVTETALIRSIQRDPRTTFILHVDFERVSLSERVAIKLPLHFVGEAPGVKMQGGILLPLLEALEVECRASDILESLDVDVSGLAEIDSSLHAGNIKLPRGYKLLTDAEEPIVKIQAPRVEEAAPAAEAEQAAPAAEGESASSEE
jgi:large subunit ribosomal protein L25